MKKYRKDFLTTEEINMATQETLNSAHNRKLRRNRLYFLAVFTLLALIALVMA